MKLKILLLIVGLGSMTALCGQTDSGKVCLTYPEYDFYADALIERNGLKLDTTILNAKIIALAEKCAAREEQVVDLTQIAANKDTIIGNWESSFTKLETRCIKAEKQAKRYKKATVIFMCISGVLALLFAVK